MHYKKSCSSTHEYCERVIRDLPILGHAMRLKVLLRRVGCRDCGKRMEAVSWLDRHARMMRRLAVAVIQARERLPTLHVAQMFGLHWDTVRLLQRQALQAALSLLPKAQL
uniref:helix-turn-helix domain-containing protein n=1 Tax=Pseudomonas hygromyciniae TaxID=2812000 RepID=UPI001F081A6D|nr:helix-turn-helix domain-containing protein [Pseudomonas hygromyciniae]